MLLLLAAALSGLQPGAVVRLPPGRHPTINITGQNFSPPVTIDARDAVVAGVRINNSSGIIWRGGTIEAPDGMTGDKQGSHGVRMRDFRDVSFDGVTFTNAKHGMVTGNGVGFTVRNSTFTGLRSDGIDSVGNSNVLIENNRFVDTRPNPKIGIRGEPGFIDGDHCDAIQLWISDASPRADDITIRGNFIEGQTQGINTFGPRGAGFNRMVVENNIIKITFPAAISVMDCHDCKVRYNTISSAPGAHHPANVRNEGTTGLICENKMLDRPGHRVAAKCPKDGSYNLK
ncbi:MAG: right-handed parallel beta-helix repeat-containing protein [Sandarakinorhabdus sp.]|nr:right-handed parallel beta-helix repeat-containing protein [Sandarakinorhabdus sp.]